jgi:hypothetical protein
MKTISMQERAAVKGDELVQNSMVSHDKAICFPFPYYF